MAKERKKVLISGYIGFGNFGDEIIFSCLTSFLKAKGVEVTALSSNPKLTSKSHSIKAYHYKKIPDILRAIFSCDILFSGGGSLLQNSTSDRSLNYYLSIINLAKMLGKRVVIFAQGLDGITGEKQMNQVRKTLTKCDLLTVRDEISKRLLDSWGLSSKLVCDPAYSIKLPPYNPQGYVGVQLRKCDLMHPLFLERLASGIAKYYRDKKIKVIPLEEGWDKGICMEFAEILRRLRRDIDVEVVTNVSIPNIIKEFSTLEYLIAMRYHACLLGAMLGIKTMPIIYDDKVLNMARKENMPYIDCSFEKDITNDFKNIENPRNPIRKRFDWNIFEEIIR